MTSPAASALLTLPPRHRMALNEVYKRFSLVFVWFLQRLFQLRRLV